VKVFDPASTRVELDSLCSLITDRIENTYPNSSSIAASRSYRTNRVENTAS
jgi:hypothetical protein